MRNLGLLPFLALLSFAEMAQAKNVRLISEPCDHRARFTSTGFTFTSHGREFVIASADFVLNGQSTRFCHSIESASGKKTPLKMLRHDWESGLALLEITTPTETSAPLKTRPAKMLEKSNSPAGRGLVVSKSSERHHFGTLDSVIELKTDGLHQADVGAAITSASGDIIGFVSSQYITEVPGSSSRVTRWLDHAEASAATTLLIPGPRVSEWVEDTVNGTHKPPLFTVTPEDQVERLYRIHAPGVAFVEVCGRSAVSGSGDDHSPIGGADPVGIGGADPVGIGGDGRSPSGRCFFRLQKSLSLATTATVRADWFQRLERSIARGVDTSIDLSYARIDGVLKPIALYSVGDLANAINRRPSAGFMLVQNSTATSDSKIRALKIAALHLQAESLRTFGGLPSTRATSYLYAGLSLTDDYREVTLEDLANLHREAVNDTTAIIYVAQYVQALIDAREALGP